VTYFAAAYVVLLLTVLAYLVIHALKVARLERELESLARASDYHEEAREEAGAG
jgi:hypothetical protein